MSEPIKDTRSYSTLRVVIPSDKNIHELMEELWERYPGAQITPLSWDATFELHMESERENREDRRKTIKTIEGACKKLRKEWL